MKASLRTVTDSDGTFTTVPIIDFSWSLGVLVKLAMLKAWLILTSPMPWSHPGLPWSPIPHRDSLLPTSGFCTSGSCCAHSFSMDGQSLSLYGLDLRT